MPDLQDGDARDESDDELGEHDPPDAYQDPQ